MKEINLKEVLLKTLRFSFITHMVMLILSIILLSSFISDYSGFSVVTACQMYTDNAVFNANGTISFLQPDYNVKIDYNYIFLIGLFLILTMEESFRLIKIYRIIREVEK